MAAIREAVNVGAHVIELDIHFTKDRELVVIHDGTVNRTTDGEGKVSDYSLAEIKKLDAGSWKSPKFKGERIPTLREALAIMPENAWIILDIKEEKELVEKVAEMIVEEDRLHQSLFGSGLPNINAARTVNPNARSIIMGPRDDMRKYVNMAIELKADFANITLPKPVTPEFIAFMKKLQKNGVHVENATVNSPEEIRRLFAAGIDFSLTNELHIAMKVVEEFGIKPLKPKFRS